MTVQLHKIIRDLWIYRLRTGLSIFAICVGLVVFGGIASALDALTASYERAFRQSNPAQVTMQVSPFEYRLIRRIDTIEGVIASDARFTISNVRLGIAGNEWISLELHAAEDYSTVRLHRIFAEPNTIGYAPPPDTIWLDRSILKRNDLSVGDFVAVQSASGDVYSLQVSGFVNDVIAYPSHYSDQAVAYISYDTLRNMKLAVFTSRNQPTYNQLYLRFDSETRNVLKIRALVNEVQNEIESHGFQIISTEFLTDAPPLKTQTDALNFLLVISTILSFGVTGVMIANFVSAIVGRQVNEIGIMKSLGAVPTQITTLFFIMMTIMGLIAFILSLPLTGLMAQAINDFLVNMIDIDVERVVVPLRIRLFQFISALLIPLLAALAPIIQGATLTVRETLRNDGNITGGFIMGLAYLPRLFISSILIQMAIRNIFMKPGRFFLTTVSLTLPGALFIASFGIEISLKRLDSQLAESLFNYDIEFSFDGTVPIRQIEQIAGKQSGVLYVESWRQASIHRIYKLPTANNPPPVWENGNRPPRPNGGHLNPPPPPNGNINNRPPPPNGENRNRPPPPPNGNNGERPPPPNHENGNRPPPPPLDLPPGSEPSISGDIPLRGIPIHSRIVRFTKNELIQGTWLQDADDILLTYEGYEALSLNVDGSRTVLVGHSTTSEDQWDVVGVTGQMLLTEGYVDINTFERLVPFNASSIRLAVITESNDVREINQVLENLREAYRQARIPVNASTPIRDLIERRGGRLDIVTQTLITLSMVIGAVSVVGLISTISINIRERTKSIGILRSLGGDYRHLASMVFIESLTIVIVSYVLAFGLSFAVGNQMSNILGQEIYALDAVYHIEWFGSVIWFVMVILVGMFSALGPAMYAINLTISDTLSYDG